MGRLRRICRSICLPCWTNPAQQKIKNTKRYVHTQSILSPPFLVSPDANNIPRPPAGSLPRLSSPRGRRHYPRDYRVLRLVLYPHVPAEGGRSERWSLVSRRKHPGLRSHAIWFRLRCPPDVPPSRCSDEYYNAEPTHTGELHRSANQSRRFGLLDLDQHRGYTESIPSSQGRFAAAAPSEYDRARSDKGIGGPPVSQAADRTSSF